LKGLKIDQRKPFKLFNSGHTTIWIKDLMQDISCNNLVMNPYCRNFHSGLQDSRFMDSRDVEI
jgi:hypothetical protein